MIHLRFFISLTSNLGLMNEHHGPLFHRWLPNGEDDALALASTDSDVDISIWFERRGYLDFRDLIQFDYHRKEVDEALVTQQAVLDAGPLLGSLTIRNVDQETITILREDEGDKKEDEESKKEYVALGKRIIGLLEPILSSLIDILRVRFGHYWIAPFEKWDSRRRSLGAYCHGVLKLQYSLDNGQQWRDFIPNLRTGYIHLTAIAPGKKTFSQYLTQNDWLGLRDLVDSGYKPSIASNALILAHELSDSGNYRQAFPEGITALELALSELFRDRLSRHEVLIKEAQSFRTLPLPTQFVIAASFTQDIAPEEIEVALKAIKTRNRIVHEGQQVGEEKKSELRSLLATIAKLIPGPRLKLPSARIPGNLLMTEEQWSKLK